MFRKLLKWIFSIVFVVALIWTIFNWELVLYGIRQGKGQLNIIWNARPVNEVLQDPSFPDSLKYKLRLIEKVRRYAIDSLGLRDTNNYKTLYDQQGKEIMWVVTACEPFQLEAKTWNFPILGSVPYKGFFEEDLANQLADELEQEGWDVNVRNPGGWSTLGWFNDPILSKMLQKGDGDLASLIIHEMVHATIFIKDSVDFNENLASFIGDRGAELFLESYFGKTSTKYLEYVDEDLDYRLFVNHVLRGTVFLDSLYQTMTGIDESLKEKLKKHAINQIVQSMDTLSLSNKKKLSKRFEKKLPNNAYFMAFIHYQSGQKELWHAWKDTFGCNLPAYIHFLSKKYPASLTSG